MMADELKEPSHREEAEPEPDIPKDQDERGQDHRDADGVKTTVDRVAMNLPVLFKITHGNESIRIRRFANSLPGDGCAVLIQIHEN